MGLKTLIDECLDLLRKVEKEFPGEPDLEALHSVTGIYAELKKFRERINTFPIPVRVFSEFLHLVRGPDAEVAKFLDFLRNCPGAFCPSEKETFLQKRQRIAGIAGRAGLEPARLFHLLSMARLKGILDKKDVLMQEYSFLIAEYLGG